LILSHGWTVTQNLTPRTFSDSRAEVKRPEQLLF
jgi:hypothetical protein